MSSGVDTSILRGAMAAGKPYGVDVPNRLADGGGR